jgi:hypothetical protein
MKNTVYALSALLMKSVKESRNPDENAQENCRQFAST